MRISVSRWTRFFLGAAALSLVSLPVLAQFPDDIPDNVKLRIGGIFASFQNNVTVSNPNAPGTGIDLTGEHLTPDHKNTFRGDGYWNFLGRSYLDFGYVDFKLDGSTSITRDIVFNGKVYKAGAEVSGESRSRYIYAAYRYGIIKNPDLHWGVSLGLTYATLSAKLAASAGVELPDGTVISGGASSERSINFPVPLIGTEIEFRLAQHLTLGARARAIGATIDPYSGSWIEYAGNLNWYVSEHFGVGGAYEYQKIHLKKDESAPNAFSFDQRYDGPRLYLLVTF
ncbi:MAG TPA: hypothetical protein VKJ00_02280 [Thermoanaerobaculia bacterium]|nr:hypothetical protein [Thermoanaerobaculia bacterium]